MTDKRRELVPGSALFPGFVLCLFVGFVCLQSWSYFWTSGSGTSLHRLLFQHVHPPLFPLESSDRWGLLSATLGLMIAAGGGIGGGGILVPIYILVLGFAPKQAIPLSNVTVFGGACANCLLNFSKRHPLVDRPLVDWDLILVMEPLTIAGALIGAFLNKMLPETFLTFMLVVLLTFTAYNTLKRAIKMYRKETKEMRQEITESQLTVMARSSYEEHEQEEEVGLLIDVEHGDEEEEEDGHLPDQNHPSQNHNPPPKRRLYSGLYAEDELSPQLTQILEEERATPAKNVHVLLVLFVVVLAINIVKGGGALPSPLGIVCGSRGFWLANAVLLFWICGVALFCRQYLIQRGKTKQQAGYRYVEGDIVWDGRSTLVYPLVCCLAGFFAGMFGVGGGIVKGPLMLAMGVHPQVSAASSACMIFFTSFTATTSFYVFGLLVEDYALACLLLGFAATYVGQVLMNQLMKKVGRSSYIAFSIGLVVLLSAFLMTVQNLVAIAEGSNKETGGLC